MQPSQLSPSGVTPPTVPLPIVANKRVEQISPMCTFEWFDNDQIIVVELRDTSRATVNAWYERSIQIRKALPPNGAAFVAIRGSGFSSPFLRERTRQIAALRSDLTTYTAVVSSVSNPLTSFARIASESMARIFPTVRLRFFTSTDDAVKWLRICVVREQQGPKDGGTKPLNLTKPM